MDRRFTAAIGAIWCSTSIFYSLGHATTFQNPGQDSTTASSVVIGCVGREESAPGAPGVQPTFIITDNRGSPPLKYRLNGEAEQLRLHVGHTVEIAGRVSSPGGARETAGAASSLPTLNVKTLTYVSTTCSK